MSQRPFLSSRGGLAWVPGATHWGCHETITDGVQHARDVRHAGMPEVPEVP
ncbi:hypothetical protein JZ785_11625 [Alicyclobacillus curvatus]|nr:hypothetical protein JZ785_11625 [Alicyclobacillus curvatus]